MKTKQYTQEDIDQFVLWAKKHLPKFDICFKTESWFQKLIGFLLYPINQKYMTHYTTVMFGKVYFPSRKHIEAWGPNQTYAILRHEFVHLMDAKRFPLWFEFSYLFLLPAFCTMRAYWEMRGYTQTMLVEYETTGEITQETIDFICERFLRSEYGWMFAFQGSLTKWIQGIREEILAGKIQGPYPYKKGIDFH